jgi:hypothetical protein
MTRRSMMMTMTRRKMTKESDDGSKGVHVHGSVSPKGTKNSKERAREPVDVEEEEEPPSGKKEYRKAQTCEAIPRGSRTWADPNSG